MTNVTGVRGVVWHDGTAEGIFEAIVAGVHEPRRVRVLDNATGEWSWPDARVSPISAKALHGDSISIGGDPGSLLAADGIKTIIHADPSVPDKEVWLT